MNRFWRDSLFWLALALGPVAWLIIAITISPVATGFPSPEILFWAVLVLPALEEFVFRGTLQPWLISLSASFAKNKCGLTLANVTTSILFAAAHLASQSAVWAALIFMPSLVFGATRDRYGSIYAPIVLHVFYNAGFIGLFVR
ncbi:MAG: JDVT-CTERM system glutamic-type intramembrane protease [Granulosicoccus sp.]